MVLVTAMIVGLYLVGRAVAEPFVIDLGDPASYRDDWGGPSLAGVLAVHCGPGLLALGLMVAAVRRRSARARASAGDPRRGW
ncbi:hypothetical protein GCM10010472_05930 [Pseudonocardia halophobica]|uniref:Uncharacterized protein n=1 Tax=Pseudonocardia halophobica TaxID=29401 RepID=A0A9W6NUH2_9PSEU|nr:hypothetical protein GCM10017577_14100 [Pseudonocardia halophobica]